MTFYLRVYLFPCSGQCSPCTEGGAGQGRDIGQRGETWKGQAKEGRVCQAACRENVKVWGAEGVSDLFKPIHFPLSIWRDSWKQYQGHSWESVWSRHSVWYDLQTPPVPGILCVSTQSNSLLACVVIASALCAQYVLSLQLKWRAFRRSSALNAMSGNTVHVVEKFQATTINSDCALPAINAKPVTKNWTVLVSRLVSSAMTVSSCWFLRIMFLLEFPLSLQNKFPSCPAIISW